MPAKPVKKPLPKPTEKSVAPPAPVSRFTQPTLKAIRDEAKKQPGVRSARHIYPRAYCVAKPATWCAVFATPSCDAEPQVGNNTSVAVHNSSAEGAQVGKWYSIAYVITNSGSGEPRVIFSL